MEQSQKDAEEQQQRQEAVGTTQAVQTAAEIAPETSTLPQVAKPNEDTATSNGGSSVHSDEYDTDALSVFFGISLETMKANPALISSLSAKLKDFQSLKSDKDVLDLNYQTLQHQSERKVQTLVDQLQTSQSELKELKLKFSQIENSKQKLEETILKTNNNDKNQLIALKSKMESLNVQNQSTAQLLETKQVEIGNLTEEIKLISKENSNLRSKLMQLETSLETTKSESWKFQSDLNTTEREIESIKQTSQWYESQLKSKSTQLEKLKGDKEMITISLETKINQLKQDYQIAKLNCENYSKNLIELNLKNEQYSKQLEDLNHKLSTQESQLEAKLSKRDELISVLETSNKDKSNRIDSLEKLYNETLVKVQDDEREYQSENEKLYKELAQRELKIEDLEKMIDQLSSGDSSLKDLNGSLSLSDLISEMNILRKEVVKQKRSKQKAEEEVETLFKELDQRLPMIQSYKDKCEDYEQKQVELTSILNDLTKENSSLIEKLNTNQEKLNQTQNESTTLSKYKVDLQRQVIILLNELQFKCNGELPLTIDEKHYINSIVSAYGEIQNLDSTDTDQLISSRLTTFKNIAELVAKNEQLLIVSRKLGEELESKTSADDDETIHKSKAAILKLQTELKNTQTQLQTLQQSNEVLQNIISQRGGARSVTNQGDVDALNERIENLYDELKSKKTDMEDLRSKYESKIISLNEKIESLIQKNSETNLSLNKQKSSNDLLTEKLSYGESMVKNLSKEKDQIVESNLKLQERLKTLEEKLFNLTNSLVSSNSSMAELEINLKGLKVEREMLKNSESQLRFEIQNLHKEKIESNSLIIKLETVNAERQSHFKETLQRYQNEIEISQVQIEQLNKKLDSSLTEARVILHSKNADSKVYQTRIDTLQEQLIQSNNSIIIKNNQLDESKLRIQYLTKQIEEMDAKNHARLLSNSSSSNLKEQLADALEDLELVTKDANKYRDLSISIEEKLNSLNETFDQYKLSRESQVSQLNSQISTLQNEIQVREKEAAGLKNQFDALKLSSNTKEEEYQLKITGLNSSIENLENLRKGLEAQVSQIKQDSGVNVQKIQELQHELSRKSEIITNLENDKTALSEEFESLKSNLETITNELNCARDELKTKSSEWDSAIVDYENQVKNWQMKCTEFESQNRAFLNQAEDSMIFNGDDLDGSLTYLKRQCDSLNEQLEFFKNEEKVLTEKVSSKDEKINSLNSQLTNLQEKVKALEELKAEVGELQISRDENNQLKDKIGHLEANIEPLQNKQDELLATISKNEEMLSLANTQIEKLKNEMEAEQGKSQALEIKSKEFSELNDKFEKMKNISRERLKQLKEENASIIEEKNKLDAKIKELGGESEELEKLKIQMRTLKNQLHEKEVEKSEIISKYTAESAALQKKIDELNKNPAGNSDVETMKTQLETEWKQRLATEIEAAKAQQLTKASNIVERRKEEYKTKEKEYQDKIESLEQNIRELESAAVASTSTDNTELIAKYEAEKQQIIKQCEEEKDKILREKKLKETLMQKKFDVYERKLKEMETTAPATPTNLPVFGSSSLASGSGIAVSSPKPGASAFNFNAAPFKPTSAFGQPAPAPASTSSMASPAKSAFSFNFQPAKRSSETPDGEEKEDTKRSKLE